jgi:hypothetical protein
MRAADRPGETDTYVFDGVKVGSAYTYLYIDLEDPDNPLSTGGNTAWDIK